VLSEFDLEPASSIIKLLETFRDRTSAAESRAPCLLQSQSNSRFLKRSTTTGLKMAMMPQLYSISGLAVELNVDRRTVAARLRNVTPDGRSLAARLAGLAPRNGPSRNELGGFSGAPA
jgi:hypothetical protein